MGRHPSHERETIDRCTGGAGVRRHGMSTREYQDRLQKLGALAAAGSDDEEDTDTDG